MTLCHATGSESHPFEVITINPAGAYNGHYGGGHQNGEDIIPPFEFQGQTYSQNWDAEGQAIHRHGCTTNGSQPTPPGEHPDDDKVTLCHATGSESNPFVVITVAAAGAFNGHLGNSHQNGEDIIPPFEFQGQTYSQNWDAEGMAIFRNGCKPVTTPGSSPPPQGGEQPPVIHTPVAESSAPASRPPARIPGAVDAGLQTTSGWEVPVGGVLIALGALTGLVAMRRSARR